MCTHAKSVYRLANAVYDSALDLSGATLTGADLRGANLTGAVLAEAALAGANLQGAALDDADLAGADLSGADLSTASLVGADLSSASLQDTDLEYADLRRANLAGALGLSQEQLDESSWYQGAVNLREGLLQDPREAPEATAAPGPVRGRIKYDAYELSDDQWQLRAHHKARSEEGDVTEMRRARSEFWEGCSVIADWVKERDWEPLVESEEFESSCDGHWVRGAMAAQFRDTDGNLSPIICKSYEIDCSREPPRDWVIMTAPPLSSAATAPADTPEP